MIDRESREAFGEQLRERRRGRPRRTIPVVITSVRIPADTYDALCRRALDDCESLHTVLVRVLSRAAGSPTGYR